MESSEGKRRRAVVTHEDKHVDYLRQDDLPTGDPNYTPGVGEHISDVVDRVISSIVNIFHPPKYPPSK